MPTTTVNPTRMELTRLKGRLRTAQRGHKLLKDKRDELMKRFMEVVREERTLRSRVETSLQQAYSSFTVASALMSPEMLEQSLLRPAQSVSLEMTSQNVMSVNVPRYAFTLGGAELANWEMFPINLNEDKRGGLAKIGPFGASSGRASSGAVYRYFVNLKAQDTYLDMRDWKRGQVRVNGHWIGRYWSIGPTQTMYVPGCWLKEGKNEIVIIDVVGVEPPDALTFVTTPILGEMRPDTDYFSFQARPKLTEKLSNPVHEGEFANNTTRQDVRFKKPVRGRYFALESLNAWDGREYAACGEIDLVDGEGKNISHAKWSIAACDSEERLAEDGSAENIVDGQTANLWHTEWKAKSPNHPHYFVIDLGQEETVGGMNFTPRQSNGAGRIRRYRAYVLDAIKTK